MLEEMTMAETKKQELVGKVISSNEEQKSSDINIPELEELKVRR